MKFQNCLSTLLFKQVIHLQPTLAILNENARRDNFEYTMVVFVKELLKNHSMTKASSLKILKTNKTLMF